MAVTEFRPNIKTGAGFDDAVTWSMIAADVNVKLYGPVILTGGSITDLPKAGSTATADDRLVCGVCTRLPRSGTLTANVSEIEVTVYGRCKLKVNDANVSLNDALSTNSTVGEAKVRAPFTISAAYSETEVTNALNGIRATFAIALSTVSSGADSTICAFVNIVPNGGAA